MKPRSSDHVRCVSFGEPADTFHDVKSQTDSASDSASDGLIADRILTALSSPRGHGVDVHLQPIVGATDGRLVACEALLRVTTTAPVHLPPEHVLEVAAAAGILDDLTWLVIEHAAADARVLAEHGLAVPVTLNVSAVSFDNPQLVDRLIQTLHRYDLPSSALVLEITERAPFIDHVAAGEVVARLSRNGFCVALDDYGIGYSDAARLASLPVGMVKIDRSTVHDHAEPRQRRGLEQLLQVTAERGLVTIAEGVESAADAAAMTALGVDWLQGFWTAPAMPVVDFLEWAQDHRDGVRSPAGQDRVTPQSLTLT